MGQYHQRLPNIILIMKNKTPTLKQRKEYIIFLEKRLNSQNYKNNSRIEEIEKTKKKLDKEKLLVKMLEK